MARIVNKIPKRKTGKYANTGQQSEDALSTIINIGEIIKKIQDNKDISDEEKDIIKKYLQKLALTSCVMVSYYNGNGLNVFQNAEKTGLTLKMNSEQKDILRKISRNTSMARILFATGKYSSYIMLVLAISNMYIYGHSKFLYNAIQPEENLTFIGICAYITYCILQNKRYAKKIANNTEKLVNINTR